MADFDAIIIGAGHNGLACAAFLSREGWRVLVIEQASEVGGGVRSDVQTLPGFCNDRYATNFSLFANSPAYTELRSEFDAHGVKFLRSDHPYASIHGAEAIRVFADGDRTEQSLARLNRSDASGWRELTAFYRRVGPSLGPLFSTELPSVAAVRRSAALVAGNRIGDTVKLARMLAQSSTEFARQFLSSPDAISILQAWGYHLDFPPEKAGGAMFAFVSAMSAAVHGMRLVEGGAGCISRALAAMIGENGGEVRTGCSVQEVVISRGRAVAVKTAAGDEISAGRAIVANVTTARIFGGLVEASKLPDRFVKRASAFKYGPGTFIIHLALERSPTWAAGSDISDFSYVHLNTAQDDIRDTYASCIQGLLPKRPLLVVSQTTNTDPSRAPAGKHVMRVHVRTVPGVILGDSVGQITEKDWQMAREPFAERVLGQVEQAIPDLRACISAVTIETPQDIERENPEFRGRGLRLGKPPSPPKLFLPADGWLVELQNSDRQSLHDRRFDLAWGRGKRSVGVHGCAKLLRAGKTPDAAVVAVSR